MNKLQNQVIALAGVFQSAKLVKQLAWTGICDQDSASTSIQSLFKINADSTESVYGKIRYLQLGLEEFKAFFEHNKLPKDQEIARYTLSLIHLERRLIKKRVMLDIIQQGVLRAKAQSQYFSTNHKNIIANLAEIYTDTLSTFKFRINVTGEPKYLTNTTHANGIRAFLLAGIRSVVLWRQGGGSRWQLIFFRKKLVNAANTLLNQITTTKKIIPS